ncbi:MAG: polysaccharide deacetylase family protein [Candidatus Rokubacteria bacterium]|nr:polysaccharide deacetylase family protein [Candidatus Rokubacteria bacterium]
MSRSTAARLIRPAVCLAAALALLQTPARAQLSANELGKIMILEYHQIAEPEARWARTPANLRRDLERLRERGYRLVGLNDVLDGRFSLPAGTSPVVLTFDDSSPGQFRYVDKNGRLEIDPDCAVGILEAFARAHPEFGVTATFYVLPGAAQPHRLFGQPEHEGRKLQYLVSRGFEIGNHTLWHANLSKYPEAVVRKQLAHAQQWIQRLVPGYRLRTLALPMGAYPKELEWAIRGSVDGVSYHHDALLQVAGGAAPSPFSRRFDPYRLPRIQVVESELAYWLRYFEQRPEERFASDGDPATVTIPRARRAELRELGGRNLRIIQRD